VWLYDADGRQYLDVYNNVPHVGHCHPHVVDALTRQIRTLNTHTRYLHEGVLEYAEKLVAKFPEPLRMAMFACTGTEANELAHRIARAYTGSTGIIAIDIVSDRKNRTADGVRATKIVDGLRQRGALVGSTGPYNNVVNVRPSMVFGRAHADLVLQRLDETLAEG